MAEVPPPPIPTQLIVFADDWGRHPSSSQHLIRELLPQYPTLWVNTVGTRKPRLNLADLRRAVGVVGSWLNRGNQTEGETLPQNLQVVVPPMYPGYRMGWQRQVNDRSIAHSLKSHLLPDHRHVVLTTLPTTAGLIPLIEVDRWVYYCVDDYSQWPGIDHGVMGEMERQLVAGVDGVACVSETLRSRIATLGNESSQLLTHGVELAFWQSPSTGSKLCPGWPELDLPVALFWGLLDERMERDWCAAVSRCSDLHAVFIGPTRVDPGVLFTADSLALGPVSHGDLPAHAAASSVLTMPYIDAPVTRAMQPLKLLEYLATMKPVVVRDLPSTRDWAECCDLARDPEQFVELVRKRVQTGTPASQLEARKRRLPAESWTAKAEQLAGLINGSAR